MEHAIVDILLHRHVGRDVGIVVMVRVLPRVNNNEAPPVPFYFGFHGHTPESRRFSEREMRGPPRLSRRRFRRGQQLQYPTRYTPVGRLLDRPAIPEYAQTVGA